MKKDRREYDTKRWRDAREIYLTKNPLCVLCAQMGRAAEATVVDHIRPWKDGGTDAERNQLFWNQDNWQALCASCHSGVKRMEELHGYSQACGVDGLPVDRRHPWNVK